MAEGISGTPFERRIFEQKDGENSPDVMAERVGFEPTVAKGYTRSPGAPDRPLQHLSANLTGLVIVLLTQRRRGWDSNPRSANAETAFRERHLKPLGHLS